MTQQTKPTPGPPAKATVAQVREYVFGAETTKQLMSLPAVHDAFVSTRMNALGLTYEQANTNYELEKMLFMKVIGDNKALTATDKLTQYSAFIELAMSGLSLKDGQSYLVPYGKKCTWQPGWKGRLEQINQRDTVLFTEDPIIVYDCDEFDHEKGKEGVIINKHKPVRERDRPADAEIEYVYWPVTYVDRQVIYMMGRKEVYQIREKSKAYKQWLADIAANPTGKKTMNGQNGQYTVDIQESIWTSSPEQAWRKTIVNRTYNNTPKTQAQKYLDDKLAQRYAEMGDVADADETGGKFTEYDFADTVVDTGTGELKQAPVQTKADVIEPINDMPPPADNLVDPNAGWD